MALPDWAEAGLTADLILPPAKPPRPAPPASTIPIHSVNCMRGMVVDRSVSRREVWVSAAQGAGGVLAMAPKAKKAPEGGEEAAPKKARSQQSVASLLGADDAAMAAAQRKDFLDSLQIPAEEASLSCVPAEC